MKTIRIGITTIALLLAAAFVFAACSGSAPQTTEAPAAQTQQASTSQQTNAVPAAPAPQQAQAATATSVPPTQQPTETATPSTLKACRHCRAAGVRPRVHRHTRNRQRKDRARD